MWIAARKASLMQNLLKHPTYDSALFKVLQRLSIMDLQAYIFEAVTKTCLDNFDPHQPHFHIV